MALAPIGIRFTVKYKRGTWKKVADAVSRLSIYGSTPVDPDLDVPGLMVEAKVPLSIIAAVDTASWTELDTDHDDGGVSVFIYRTGGGHANFREGDSGCARSRRILQNSAAGHREQEAIDFLRAMREGF